MLQNMVYKSWVYSSMNIDYNSCVWHINCMTTIKHVIVSVNIIDSIKNK